MTHEVDSDQYQVDEMEHHVLHVNTDTRVAVIADLCAAPGKSLVFTRTKHGAKRLTEQLIKAGVPTLELHGNLSQAVRAKNLAAYSSGKVETLVATDIAARGIHVDDIAIVIHADPPEEHKAFLHRSGRTARAGASGTVVTMMTDQQRRSVKNSHKKPASLRQQQKLLQTIRSCKHLLQVSECSVKCQALKTHAGLVAKAAVAQAAVAQADVQVDHVVKAADTVAVVVVKAAADTVAVVQVDVLMDALMDHVVKAAENDLLPAQLAFNR